MQKNWTKIFLPPVIAILGLATVSADELKLANGDVLQGKLISEEGGRIKFESPILGVLDLDATKASVMLGEPQTTETGPQKALLSKKSTVGPANKEAPQGWRSKVDLGFNWQDGRKDRKDLSFRFQTERIAGKDDYKIQGRYVQAENNGSTSADRRDASLRWRRNLDKRWFTQTNTVYYDDEVKRIDLNFDQNLGIGYRVLNSDRAKANVGAGLTFQYREAEGIEDRSGEFGEFFQDLTWRISDRIELFQEAGALISPDGRPIPRAGGVVDTPESDTPNYRITFQSVLRGRVTESLSVNLRYEHEFDNAILDREDRSDQRVTTSLGYLF